MLCFAFGALGLAGLFALARHRRQRLCGYSSFYGGPFAGGLGYHDHARGPFGFGRHRRHQHQHDDYGGAGGYRRRGRFLFELFRRIDASPGQEKAIARMVESFRPHIEHTRSELADVRRDLASALASQELDEQAVAAVFARSNALASKLNDDLQSAFVALHTTLDAEQRVLLAKLIGEGRFDPRFFDGGPVAI